MRAGLVAQIARPIARSPLHGTQSDAAVGALGVPTEIKDTSVAATAATTSSVAVSLPCSHRAGYQRVDQFLDDGGASGGEHREFFAGHVNGDDLMAQFGEAATGHDADIADTED